MTRKDYERAATIAQQYEEDCIVEAFVVLFQGDNPHFDEARFRAACVLGANVKAKRRAR